MTDDEDFLRFRFWRGSDDRGDRQREGELGKGKLKGRERPFFFWALVATLMLLHMLKNRFFLFVGTEPKENANTKEKRGNISVFRIRVQQDRQQQRRESEPEPFGFGFVGWVGCFVRKFISAGPLLPMGGPGKGRRVQGKGRGRAIERGGGKERKGKDRK